ncbi:hypothetical protein [Pseudobacteriovorax antillogorgiicola]|uniref:Myosin tail n=1 Tax=Pseudobacteriovorax antillogorgiicola TaxID=1513793 RepID=A0A1Y6CPS9_9BACT|nr:hypothetical protein [Pseudobacteriovorax antillogorgiicola]TCS42738.1 myosin-like protein [Pseudobacteriovorax antillogorgiicola]SMF82187.1 Myosin tail [Pseudobacteriovorax antillogorgiicola]
METKIIFGLVLLTAQACTGGKSGGSQPVSAPAPEPAPAPTEELKDLQQQLEDKKSEIDELQSSLEDKKSTLEENARKIAELEQQLTESGTSRTNLETQIQELETTNKTLEKEVSDLNAKVEQLNTEVESLNAAVITKEAAIEKLKLDLEKAESDASAVQIELEEAKQELEQARQDLANSERAQAIQELEDRIAQLEEKLNSEKEKSRLLSEELDQKKAEISDLKTNLAAVESQLNSASNGRDELLKTINNQKKEIEKYKDFTVKLALDALGKEKFFVVQDSILTKNFSLDEGQSCSLILAFDDQALRYDGVGVSGFNLSPYSLGYQKVSVCRDSEGLSVQKEKGVVVKGYPTNSTQGAQLISKRIDSSCDDESGSVFASNLQLMYPYSAAIDALETIGLMMPRGISLEYNMGSSTPNVFAESCEKFLGNPFSENNELVKTACEVVLLGSVEGLKTGCHKEVQESGKYKIVFETVD